MTSREAIDALKAEIRGALLVAAVVVPLVAISNSTASMTLILVHAGVLLLLVPVLAASATIVSTLLFSSRNTESSLPLDIALHLLSVVIATIVMVPVVSSITDLPLCVIASKPLLAGVVPVSLAYVIWRVSLFYRRTRIRAAQLEAERAAQALAALSAQFKPHFLFNALSSIEQLVSTDPNRAREAISNLSELYRQVLTASKATFFSMRQELALARHYLEIQKMRFGERLGSHIRIDENAREAAVPATLLLTLVENAVKHGIETRLQGGIVDIAVRKENDLLTLSVANPRPPVTPNVPRTGHGLRDLRERLGVLYGDAAQFQLKTEKETVTASVTLPFSTVDDEEVR